MKLSYKGVFKSMDQLPVGNLPENAVKFKEPETFTKVNLVAFLFMFPVLIAVFIIQMISCFINNGQCPNINFQYVIVFFLLSLLTTAPHELLHAVCLGKGAEAEIYIHPKQLLAFVICTKPMSKSRFIWMSMCPNLVLGWIPLMLSAFIPYSGAFNDNLFTFSFFTILMGAADYMNVFNAIRQMPKGSMQQMSGIHSYWFMP